MLVAVQYWWFAEVHRMASWQCVLQLLRQPDPHSWRPVNVPSVEASSICLSSYVDLWTRDGVGHCFLSSTGTLPLGHFVEGGHVTNTTWVSSGLRTRLMASENHRVSGHSLVASVCLSRNACRSSLKGSQSLPMQLLPPSFLVPVLWHCCYCVRVGHCTQDYYSSQEYTTLISTSLYCYIRNRSNDLPY